MAMAKAEKVTRKVVDLHAAARAAEVKGGNLYTRSIQAKSNIASTHNKTADALVQNIRG
jgi:hypothetical protein